MMDSYTSYFGLFLSTHLFEASEELSHCQYFPFANCTFRQVAIIPKKFVNWETYLWKYKLFIVRIVQGRFELNFDWRFSLCSLWEIVRHAFYFIQYREIWRSWARCFTFFSVIWYSYQSHNIRALSVLHLFDGKVYDNL